MYFSSMIETKIKTENLFGEALAHWQGNFSEFLFNFIAQYW